MQQHVGHLICLALSSHAVLKRNSLQNIHFNANTAYSAIVLVTVRDRVLGLISLLCNTEHH